MLGLADSLLLTSVSVAQLTKPVLLCALGRDSHHIYRVSTQIGWNCGKENQEMERC